MYLPGWDPSEEPYANTTIDLSHAAIARSDVGRDGRAARRAAAAHPPHRRHRLGQGRAPGAGPRRRWAPTEFLRHLAGTGFDGEIVLEINTRKAADREERERDLRESLEFAREHFVVDHGPGLSACVSSGPPRGRRPGSPDTRAAILAAARASFAGAGVRRYDGPRASPRPPASTPRWCTTTSAPRTTCSSPRCELPVDPRVLLGPAVAGPVDRPRAVARRLPLGLGRPEDPAAAAGLVRGIIDPSANRLLSRRLPADGARPDRRRPRHRPARAADAAGRLPADRPDPDALRARRRTARLHAPRPGRRDVRADPPALPDGRPAVSRSRDSPSPKRQPTRCGVADSTWRATGVPATVSVSGIGTHCSPSTRYRPW